jgi:hypothetical protein
LGDTWNELSRSVSLSQHFQTKSVHHLRSPFYITSPPNKWVCLKIGYIPNYSHLIGIMIINHWV